MKTARMPASRSFRAGAAEGYAEKKIMGSRDEAAAAGSGGAFVIGRVESRLERLVRLVTGELVQANACPCKVRQFMLLQRVGQKYQPVWWEA